MDRPLCSFDMQNGAQTRAKNCLLETRREVVRGWNEVADSLVAEGQAELTLAVRRFAGSVTHGANRIVKSGIV